MSGHHPTVLTTGRHGSWASCSCGWTSDGYRNGMASSLAWALHMADRALRKRGAAEAIAYEDATEAALERAHWWNQGAKYERRHAEQDANVGGYTSSRPATDLRPPPRGPAPGARTSEAGA